MRAANEALARAGAERLRVEIVRERSARLCETLEHEPLVAAIARMAVPELADLALVHLAEDDGIRREAAWAGAPLAVVGGSVVPMGREGERRHGPLGVLATATAELVEELDDARLSAMADDDELLAAMRAAGARSYVSVPLATRGCLLGALTLVSGSDRRYTPPDLPLLGELARRAAVALHNARAHREAVQALRRRDDLLAVAAHELRTPLTSLQLLVQMLARDARRAERADAVVTEQLESAERSVSRLSHLVGSLLDLSQVQSGRLELVLEDTDLAALARDVVARWALAFEKVGCTVVLDAAEPVVGRWDRLRLEQVVANLLSNAAKYGGGGPVSVSVAMQGDAARLVVRDRGAGIPEERLPMLFARFERCGADPHVPGLGLGLFIVREIVRAHGGEVTVASAVGEGSTFAVTLPRMRG